MPSRRKTREFVLQVLFAADALGEDPLDTLLLFETHFSKEDDEDDPKIHSVIKDFAEQLIDTVSRNREDIDNIISRLSRNWTISRINRVDRNVLRMAIAEMTAVTTTPGRVVLDEAIEIGKKYGAENSSLFINGILDRFHNLLNLPGSTINLQAMLTSLDESSPKV